MRNRSFERPTHYYDENLFTIDEQLCDLLRQRKELSNNNPGFPPLEYISKWADTYGIYEGLLQSLFVNVMREDDFRPQIKPKGFRKHIPVLKTYEKDDYIFSVPFIRQYENASLLNFNIDWDSTNESSRDRRQTKSYDLDVGEGYDCRNIGGGGTKGHTSMKFIVSPPLPDNVSGTVLVIREYNTPSKQEPTNFEIKWKLT